MVDRHQHGADGGRFRVGLRGQRVQLRPHDDVHAETPGDNGLRAARFATPWQRRTNVWRKVTTPGPGANRPKSVKPRNQAK